MILLSSYRFCCSCLLSAAALIWTQETACAADFEAARDGWKTGGAIAVKNGGAKPDVVQLFSAFNGKWHTVAGDLALGLSKKPTEYDETEVDRSNGYLWGVSYDRQAGYPVELHAAIWRKSDGHTLLGLSLANQEALSSQITCFYDYDPKTSNLAPLADYPVANFRRALKPGPRVVINAAIPRQGKDMQVVEGMLDDISISLIHQYRWNGLQHVYAGADIDTAHHLADLVPDYDPASPFVRYDLADLDGDGIPELLLSDQTGEQVAVFTIYQDNAWHVFSGSGSIRTGKGVVLMASSCGSGCRNDTYAFLKNSDPQGSLTVYELTPPPGAAVDDAEDENSYVLQMGEEVEQVLDRARAYKMISGWGTLKDYNPDWKPLRSPVLPEETP